MCVEGEAEESKEEGIAWEEQAPKENEWKDGENSGIIYFAHTFISFAFCTFS